MSKKEAGSYPGCWCQVLVTGWHASHLLLKPFCTLAFKQFGVCQFTLQGHRSAAVPGPDRAGPGPVRSLSRSCWSPPLTAPRQMFVFVTATSTRRLRLNVDVLSIVSETRPAAQLCADDRHQKPDAVWPPAGSFLRLRHPYRRPSGIARSEVYLKCL